MSTKSFSLFLSACALSAALLTSNAAQAGDGRDTGRGDHGHYEGRGDNGHGNWDRRNWDRGNGWNGNRGYSNGRTTFYVNRPRVVTRYVQTRPTFYNETVYYSQPRYFVGQRLDRYQPVPRPVLVQLEPAPYGYYYSMENDNVFLVSQRDNVIVQILDLLLR
ncbi:MAG: hypothetical protein JWM96_903 [Alphaproteobacteria bacterium]|nr:hypothetical protein [Alphaproteobacteria bacterium]